MSVLLLSVLLTAYDPLAVPGTAPKVEDLTVHDARRARDLPVRVFLPASTAPAPVVLFSHGLGGSREGSRFLGEHWARRGYVAVFLQHPGSDDAVWKGAAEGKRLDALKAAATVDTFLQRVEDVPAVLDALTTWHAAKGHVLSGRLELTRVAMTGHSFGAVTTQAVSGQQFPLGRSFTDPRIKAAVAFSPSVPRRGDATRAFAKVRLPWLLMTGTKDEAPIGGQTAKSRLQVFPALPPGQKYQLVLEGAEHSAFTDRALPGDAMPRNPNHHRLILATSTAFLDAVLEGNPEAKRWLEGEGVRALLEQGDTWNVK